MFKKENLMTTILVFVVLVVVGLGIYGSIKQKEEVVEDVTKEVEIPFNMKEQPLVGKEDAKSQLAVYFDYSCSHCAEWETTMLDQVQKLIKEDEEVSLRFVNYQFLSQASILAGIGGEIVQEFAPENFVKYTKSIFALQHEKTKGNLTQKVIIEKVLENVKDKTEKEVEELLKDEKYEKRVQTDRDYATKVGVTGTPTLILNDEEVLPAYDIEAIKNAIKESREEEKKAEKE